MSKLKIGILYFLCFLSIFGIDIQNIRFNNSPKQIVLDIKGEVTPKYNVNYDEVTRLIFLEVENSKIIENIDRKIEKNDDYIEKIEAIDLNESTAFFITLKEDVKYKVTTWHNPTRIVFNLQKDSDKPIIVIDPGHGGRDPGAINGKYKEKDLVLSVSKYLKDILKNDFKIIMTRSTDKFISLNERSAIANRHNANLLISIHANASPSKTARGFEVFYYSKNQSEYAKQLAQFENSVEEKFGGNITATDLIVNDILYRQNQERSAFLANQLIDYYPKQLNMIKRGSHGANLAVLRGTNAPSILIELGFITNNSEASKMFRRENQKKMAQSIAKIVKEYFKK
ncbi:N-acetylmuramoyl-L-alanine amidase [Hypnocyclicus thermotrophus]|uniref:N-acetylmuramoyl-L-alanine amidase n=1 Tax=Hypnocyclicus thermotrophus TaxID=1627895 RepID=A0AA46I623_9FUSO|nr:N-acetylmuramoyl-L-alanine amidase [Hypnocyclicus thermotrophus]TDT70505.1 N-acetylmuramoyl-L-alanine amidase [Hypnocyclicus thermotrophus]